MKISAYEKVIISISVLIALVPPLGFPQYLENPFLVMAGVLIIVLIFADAFFNKEETEEKKELPEQLNESIEE